MDMSKLPRMSNSPAPPPQPSGDPAPARAEYQSRVDPAIATAAGAEIWIAAALGVIFMIMGRTFGAYLFATLAGRPFPTGVIWQTGPNAGLEVAYPDLQGFTMLTDASIFLFGLTLVLDAIVLFASAFAAKVRQPLVLFGLTVTVLVTVFNIYVVIKLLSSDITPIISLLACAFGVYIAIYQWNLFRAARAMRETPVPPASV
jgi:hypothetical protein